MKRFSQACLLVFLVALSLSCPAAMKRLTHSFHVARLFVTLLQEPCPKWTGFNSLYDESVNVSSLEKVRQVLSQDFDYLGRGSQAFVFASRDGSAVLKLFIFDSVDSFIHRFFHSLFRMSFIPKEPEKSAFGLGQSPYNRRSQVGSCCINTDQLAKVRSSIPGSFRGSRKTDFSGSLGITAHIQIRCKKELFKH